MKTIIGLGNIGERYERNRHNAGFMALDKFVNQLKKEITPEWKLESKLKSIICKVNHKGQQIILAKPTTLMNLSGLATSKILNFYKASVEDLLVIYDDIDLPLGKIRIREQGSAGTHNGMKSIIQEIGSQEFKRIRIGIESRGDTAPKQQDLSSFVLSDFLEEESLILDKSLEDTVREIDGMI